MSLFADYQVGTQDTTSWCVLPDVIKFRNEILGGEATIMKMNSDLAHRAGMILAQALGTDTLYSPGLAMVNVSLPFSSQDIGGSDKVRSLMERLMKKGYVVPVFEYRRKLWIRVSAQAYINESDIVKFAICMSEEFKCILEECQIKSKL